MVFRPEREAQVIDGLKAANPGPLQHDSVAPIWREIMSACRALETPTRVAYLGPAGTFSEQAALGFFGSSIVRVPCASIDEVFRATSAGAADFGVVPVENSTEGVVARSLDLFLTTPLFIIGETSLFVRHNLLRRENSLDGIAGRAARTRRRWRSATPGSATTCPTPSAARWRATPKARAWPALDPTLAAIASERAGSEYGLHVVAPAIQDDAAQPHPLRHRHAPAAPPGAQGLGPRLHQPGGLGDQPARRGARHAGAAEGRTACR